MMESTLKRNEGGGGGLGPWVAHLNPCHEEKMLTTKYKSLFDNTYVYLGFHLGHNQSLPTNLV